MRSEHGLCGTSFFRKIVTPRDENRDRAVRHDASIEIVEARMLLLYKSSNLQVFGARKYCRVAKLAHKREIPKPLFIRRCRRVTY